MNKTRLMVTGVIAAAMGAVLGTVALAESRVTFPGISKPVEGLPISAAMAEQGVLWHGNDLGAGERILLVVGGAFRSREAAERANESIGFGDLHGYYVASIDQFEGLREELGSKAGDFVLVSAFRTERGAADFMMLARANDAPALLTPRLLNRGYEYVGLGQEPHPDGSGPLIGPLPGVST